MQRCRRAVATRLTSTPLSPGGRAVGGYDGDSREATGGYRRRQGRSGSVWGRSKGGFSLTLPRPRLKRAASRTYVHVVETACCDDDDVYARATSERDSAVSVSSPARPRQRRDGAKAT